MYKKPVNVLIMRGLLINIQVDRDHQFFLHYSMVFTEQQSLHTVQIALQLHKHGHGGKIFQV